MELRDYIRVIRAHIWLIALITILGGAISFGVGALLPLKYQASTSLLVKTQDTASTVYNEVLASEQLAATYAELLTKRPVIETVAQDLGLAPDQLGQQVHARLIPDTTLIEVTVENSNPLLAAEIAKQIVTVSNASARDLAVRDVDLIVVEPPAVPTTPERSGLIYGVLGTLTSFLLGLGLAFLLAYLSDAIETASEVKGRLGIACLGTIPRASRSDSASQLSVLQQPHAQATEAYRSIRAQLHLASSGGSLKKLLITSADASTGKTALAANLGVTLAQARSRVILIDANTHFPALHAVFNMSNTAGLTDWLSNDIDSTDTCLKKTPINNLQIITSGPQPSDPSALLESARMDDLVKAITPDADWIIFDSPALLDVTDAIELVGKVDGVIFVIQATRTSRQAARLACEALRGAGANILGAVITEPQRSLRLHRPAWRRLHRPAWRAVKQVEPLVPTQHH